MVNAEQEAIADLHAGALCRHLVADAQGRPKGQRAVVQGVCQARGRDSASDAPQRDEGDGVAWLAGGISAFCLFLALFGNIERLATGRTALHPMSLA